MQRKILLTPIAAATAWWRAYCDRHRRRQAIAELEAFSDRELNDIGVRRSEIDCAVHHGIWRRPLPKATAQVTTPVAPHEIMRKQGKDIRDEYFAHPF